jgi:hypothetical protein
MTRRFGRGRRKRSFEVWKTCVNSLVRVTCEEWELRVAKCVAPPGRSLLDHVSAIPRWCPSKIPRAKISRQRRETGARALVAAVQRCTTAGNGSQRPANAPPREYLRSGFSHGSRIFEVGESRPQKFKYGRVISISCGQRKIRRSPLGCPIHRRASAVGLRPTAKPRAPPSGSGAPGSDAARHGPGARGIRSPDARQRW